VFEDIQQVDSRARYLVKFNGSQKVSKYRHVDVFSGKDPEYSFEKREGTAQYSPKHLVKLATGETQNPYGFLDCIRFQNKVVGKALLLFAEVEKIKSRRSSVESTWSNLQLWEYNGVRTIKFFSTEENIHLEISSRSRKPLGHRHTKFILADSLLH
jgi:hypothetical protein